MSLTKPQVGQHVTVTTKYRNTYIYSDEEYVYSTYTGVVSRPEPWYKDGQFKLTEDKPDRMVYRTLDMSSIVSIEVH